MTKEKSEKLREIYDTLLELGVTFYYGSESVSTGEITSIEFTKDDIVKLELDEFNEVELFLMKMILLI